MKFNMGCGRKKIADWINVDAYAEAEPDVQWDLEVTPWPWPSDCATVVRFNHSLEHMGADPKVFLAIMQELYRICAPGAEVHINAPHPRHDNYINDPTHVRAISPAMLCLFDREQTDEWERQGAANSPLARYIGVDFRIVTATTLVEEPYRSQVKIGQISQKEIQELIQRSCNIAYEYRIVLEARKPVAG
jgi:hypothetical protein